MTLLTTRPLHSAPSLPAAGTYGVTWVESADAVGETLWAACFPQPLEGLWWYRSLERAKLEDQFTFAYAIVSRDGVPIGIAPAFQMDLALEIVLPDEIKSLAIWIGKTFPALRYQRTLFIGSPCAEEGTIGLIPGVALSDVMPALVAAVEQRATAIKAHMIVWKDMPETACRQMEAATLSRGYFKVPSFPGTQIENLPSSFDGYLKSLPSSHRYHLKKKLKASKSALDLTCTIVQKPDAATLAQVWPLFMQTYERATTQFERLTPAFFDELAKIDSTHFILLRRRSDNVLVAFMLCYASPGHATNKFIGIDYTLGTEFYLYFRLFEEFVIWATSLGATSLQSGQTGYRAKFDLGHEPAPLYNLARNRNWLMNKVSALVARSISWSTLDKDLKVYVEARARKGDKRGS